MITIVLTYRDRSISLLRNCLKSLKTQSISDFKVILVDYGSTSVFKEKLIEEIKNYPFVNLIRCETDQQLWCKSRAINIALKRCETEYLFVGDVDMIFHPNFIEKLEGLKNKNSTIYFQVGFLSKEESNKNLMFQDFKINFKSTEEATGMTLYHLDMLRYINGYDEFYHGWGAEDTDVHVRLKNAGYTLTFYDHEILMLHQWHPKNYRTKKNEAPFHSSLEKINHEYLKFSRTSGKIKANTGFAWGIYKEDDYNELNNVNKSYHLSNRVDKVKALVNNILANEENITISLKISEHKKNNFIKQRIINLLGKKTISYFEMDVVNDFILESIIFNFRNQPYHYKYNTSDKTISLTIKL